MSSSCRRLVCLMLLALGSIKAQLEDPEDIVDRPWVNEFHYDNVGTDVNEFVEVAAPADLDISTYQLVLYNGFYGYMYDEDAFHPLTTFEQGDTVNGVTFYSKMIRPQNCSELSSWCGLQNGKDGFALANYFTETSGRVVEFISYEGTFVGKNGPAVNMTSLDIGVEELSTTPRGWSISRVGTGCHPTEFYWAETNTSTVGTVNMDQTTTCAVAFINEFHYENENGAEGQFVEVAANVEDISTYSVVLYSGEDGMPYDAVLLSSFAAGETTEEGLTFYHYDFPSIGGGAGMVIGTPTADGNGTMAPAGMALVNNDETVLEFISYGGEFTAEGGVAEGMTSMDVGVTEDSSTPVGSSLQLTGKGCSSEDFVWTAVEANNVDINPQGDTRGAVNIGQEVVCVTEPVEETETVAPEDEDDFLDADDDFLDPDNIVIFEAQDSVSKTYYEGARPTERIGGQS